MLQIIFYVNLAKLLRLACHYSAAISWVVGVSGITPHYILAFEVLFCFCSTGNWTFRLGLSHQTEFLTLGGFLLLINNTFRSKGTFLSRVFFSVPANRKSKNILYIKINSKRDLGVLFLVDYMKIYAFLNYINWKIKFNQRTLRTLYQMR